MKIIRTLIFYLSIFLLFIVMAPPALFHSYLTRKYIKTLYRWARWWAKLLLWINGISVKAAGLENIPESEPLIFASNHQSLLDIPVFYSQVNNPPADFFIKEELYKVPLFGGYLKISGHIKVDRGRSFKASYALEKTIKEVQSGKSLVIYPEGTRTPDGEIKRFKRGVEKIAQETGFPVVPVAIKGTFDLMPKKSIWFSPHPVCFSVGKPLKFKDAPENFTEVIEKQVRTLFNA
jgi:1-acyl-sn-glycerol-3-phosphate acyltransferase